MSFWRRVSTYPLMRCDGTGLTAKPSMAVCGRGRHGGLSPRGAQKRRYLFSSFLISSRPMSELNSSKLTIGPVKPFEVPWRTT